ncbi:ABC transporter permease [Desulfobacula sp.]
MKSSKSIFRIVTGLYLALFFAYMFLPLIFMTIIAFNANDIPQITPWKGFTLMWFGELAKDNQMWSALWNSFIVAFSVVAISVPIGLGGALLLTRLQFKARNFVYGVLVSPILTPGIILGISTFLFWDSYMNIPGGLWTAILGQATFISSYCMLLIMSRAQRFDLTQEEAAFDLGATHRQVFWKITLPFLWPALISSMALAFMQSFDNYNTTLFAIGVEQTLPIYIGTKLRSFISPAMNALAVVFIVLTIIGAIVYEYRRRREIVKAEMRITHEPGTPVLRM